MEGHGSHWLGKGTVSPLVLGIQRRGGRHQLLRKWRGWIAGAAKSEARFSKTATSLRTVPH
jgi:hypothetical protein